LEVLVTLCGHHKPVYSLAWAPALLSAPSAAEGNAEAGGLLATGSEDGTVRVVDVGDVLGAAADRDRFVPCDDVHRSYKVGGCVHGLSWSPHTAGLLVAAGADGTVQVWDILANTAVSNFRGHRSKVLTVLWSPLQPNLVLSGGADQQLCMWDNTDQPHLTPPPPSKKGKGKKVAGAAGVAADANGGGGGKGLVREVGCGDRTGSGTGDASPVLANSAGASAGGGGGGGGGGKRGGRESGRRTQVKIKTLLPSASVKQQRTELTQSRCVELASSIYQPKTLAVPSIWTAPHTTAPAASAHDVAAAAAAAVGGSDSAGATTATPNPNPNLGLFGSRADAAKLVATDAAAHVADKRVQAAYVLQLWGGDPVSALETACRDGTLTDAMVAMAPMAGHAVWMKVVGMYAAQLVAQGEHHLAVGYQLATHNVNAAIAVYRSAEMYEEAVALAKSRLAKSDPTIGALYTAWVSI
jgi:hypothetical protein